MMTEGVEQVAARISAHEAVCAERWGTIRLQLLEMRDALKSLWWTILTAAGVLI